MRWFRGGLIVSIALSLALACSDKGNNPKPVKYNVYAGSSYSTGGRSMDGALYILDADSLMILDSIPNVGQVEDLAISPDGRSIYAECWWRPSIRGSGEGALLKIDARTLGKADSMPVSDVAALTLLDKGRVLLRRSSSCTSELITPANLQVTVSFNDSLCRMGGPVKGTKVAAQVISDPSRVRGTDVISGTVFGNYTAHLIDGDTLIVLDAVLHQDNQRLFLIATGKGNWFLVGNLHTGETLLEYNLAWAQEGQIASSDDGKYVAIAATGTTSQLDPFYVLQVFELSTMESLEWDDPSIIYGKGSVRFHPDGHSVLLASTGGGGGGWQGPVQLASVPDGTLLRELEQPFSQTETGAIAIGQRQ